MSDRNRRVNKRRVKKTKVVPGFRLTLGITVSMLSLVILIPLVSVLACSLRLSPGRFLDVILQSNVRNAFRTSFLCAGIAAFINSIFGFLIAWVLVKYEFPGKRLLDGIIELPFALPTAVAGITLSKLYSEDGVMGKLFGHLGIQTAYNRIGITIALVFIGIPFVVRAIQPVLEKLDVQYEEAAQILGASRFRTIRKVIVPEIRPAMLTGFGLAFARGIGEYGSVIYIAGNSAKEHTQVVSYVIMQKLNYLDYASATAIALVMLILSFLILLIIDLIQVKQAKRVNTV